MISKVKAALFIITIAIGASFNAAADSPYEICIFECIDKRIICLDAGANPSDCDRFYRLCRNNCGVPQ